MQNLAGVRDCDKTVKSELEVAGAHPVKVDRMNSEVPTSYIGVLNGFKFMRAWYYWVVTGDMPLNDAIKIYETFGKELEVRTEGMAGNDDPRKWAKNKNYDKEIKPYLDQHLPIEELTKVSERISKQGEQVISTYHVDTQEGLNELCKYIVENNIQCKLR